MLDSIGGDNSHTVKILQDYLRCEWEMKKTWRQCPDLSVIKCHVVKGSIVSSIRGYAYIMSSLRGEGGGG